MIGGLHGIPTEVSNKDIDSMGLVQSSYLMHLSPRLKKEEPEQPGIPTPKLVRKKKIGGKDDKPEDKRKITK